MLYFVRMNEDLIFSRNEAAVAEPFLRRMKNLLDENDYAAYLLSLKRSPMRMARKNPLKSVPDELIAAELGGYPLMPENAKPGLCPLHAAGAYYVQEPAAAEVAALLAPLLPPNATVLDMCAAPGGKVTASASARPDCNFFANEVVFSRAKILLSNAERLGLRNCTIGSMRPDEVARIGSGMFDAVIADVPCSGEGMLRKTEFHTSDISDEAVAACAERASKILDACDECLKFGGLLLFSTCTFNKTENEEQVFRLIREKGYEPVMPPSRPTKARAGFDLPEAVRFFPQDGGGEGHFACVLKKPSGNEHIARKKEKSAKRNSANDKRVNSVLNEAAKFTSETFERNRIVFVGDGCEYVSQNYPFASFPALRRGMRVADFAGERAILHHHFATAARPNFLIDSPNFPPKAPELASYLAGNEFSCSSQDGFRAVRVAGLPLGLIKVSNGTAKNRYPKGLRFIVNSQK